MNEKALKMDWTQVALNGGPPCFGVLGDLDTLYCGRAQRWAGHNSHHKFVSLDDLLATARKEEREAAFKEAADYIRRQWLAAYPVEVFPEPPTPPAECSRDRISAAMGRHMATKLIEHFETAITDPKDTCPHCNGSGFESDSVTPCEFCGGDGWVFQRDVQAYEQGHAHGHREATDFCLRLDIPPASTTPVVDGISWSALLAVLERIRSKNRNPDNEWYHGWNAAIQCLINDINARAATASTVAPDSSEAWQRWFQRVGDKASAEIVNATADLVTDERLAALSKAGVLPTLPADTETQ